MSDEPEATVKLAEVRVEIRMGDGDPYMHIDYDDEMHAWTVLGLLTAALDYVRDEIRTAWEDDEP